MSREVTSNNTLTIKKNKYILVGIILIIFAVIILYKILNSDEIFLVKKGELEHTTLNQAYIIKNDTIIKIDTSKVLIPVVQDGMRVSKGDVIASYRGSEYQEYVKKLTDMDNEIRSSMSNINIEYSSEVDAINQQITSLLMTAKGTSSYSKMQEYTGSVNNLLNKKAKLVASLSPSDAHVKELIESRNRYEEQSKNSVDNIKASIGGVVTYSVDGLEDKLLVSNINSMNYEDVKNMVSQKQVDSGSIKISNNYEAYMYIKEKNIDEKLLENGKKYTIRIVDSDMAELEGELVKFAYTEEGYEVLFKVTNGIEKIANKRETEIEVVWTSYTGLIAPNKAIYKDEKGTFVNILIRGQAFKVRVNVDKENSQYSIISNIDGKQDYVLEMYDELILHSN